MHLAPNTRSPSDRHGATSFLSFASLYAAVYVCVLLKKTAPPAFEYLAEGDVSLSPCACTLERAKENLQISEGSSKEYCPPRTRQKRPKGEAAFDPTLTDKKGDAWPTQQPQIFFVSFSPFEWNYCLWKFVLQI